MAQTPLDTKQSLVGVQWTHLQKLIEFWRAKAFGLAMLLVLGCSSGARAQAQQSNPLNQQTDGKGTGANVDNRSAHGEGLTALPDTPEPKPGERPSLFAPLKFEEQDTIYVPIGERQMVQWANVLGVKNAAFVEWAVGHGAVRREEE